MTKLYKLTTQDNCTRKGYSNETLWGENVTHSKYHKTDPQLCSNDVIHAYINPRLAVILNPRHANIKNPKLWLAKGDVVVSEGQLKVGCTKLTTLKVIPLPEISKTQKVAFAIFCAKEVFTDSAWNAWADKWLSGEDRSKEAAYAAAYAAYVSANAAYVSANAANAAAYAADADAAYAAYYAAKAFNNKKDIDLIKILDEVMENY